MNYKSKILSGALLFLLVATYLTNAQVKTKSADAAINKVLPLDPAVRTGKLLNGFTYYIRHNEEPKNRVVMFLVNKVGSVLEDEDQRGLAHFMEHMSFNGTRHFPHNELINYLQKSGIRFGADINAYTSFEETVYQLPIPSDNPELLKRGIEIMRDWAQEATLDEGEIEKERGVVLEEKRLGKGAQERMQRVYWPVLLNKSRYAVRVPIGLDTVLKNFKKPAIERFYKDWYRPDLQALVIVGDINVNDIEKTIKIQFASLKNPEHERKRPAFTVPLNGENRFIMVTDKEMTSTTAEIIINHPELTVRTAVDFRKLIIQGLINQMLGDRYAELSRKANPPFVQGGASIGNFINGLDCFDVGISAKPGELESGFKAAWRETERAKRFGFTETELKRAKTASLNNIENGLKEKDKTNSEDFVKDYLDYFLKGAASPGIIWEYRLTKNDLRGISLSEVNAFIAAYISDRNRDVLVLGPEHDNSNLPNQADINNWFDSVKAENLLPYGDEVITQPLLTVQPVPGKVIREQYDKDFNLTTLTLSNGVKALVKPTDFKNDEILFTGFAPGGTSLSSDVDFQSADIAGALVPAGGAGNFNPDQMDKFLEGKQGSVSPYIGDREEGVSGKSTQKDLEIILEMTYAYFTQPRKDTNIFTGYVQRAKAQLLNRENDPKSVFGDTIHAVLGNYNIRRTGPTVEKLNQVNLDKAYNFYKDRFADASNFTFTFVGNITINKIKPLLEKYLGSLPSTHAHEQAKDLGIHIPEGEIKKIVYKGSDSVSTVMLVFSNSFDYTEKNKISLDALKEVLTILLLQRLREEESGVYSPAVFVHTSKYPQSRYSLIVQFGCSPRNVDKLVASTLDEIDKLKVEGPLQENVDKWRAEEKTSFSPQLRSNDFWLDYISGQLQNQEELTQVSHYINLLDKVTRQDVRDAAAKYLSEDNYIRLVLLPENTKHQ